MDSSGHKTHIYYQNEIPTSVCHIAIAIDGTNARLYM